MSDISDRIELVCHGLGFDLFPSPGYSDWQIWCECAELWGPVHAPALGCLLSLVATAHGRDPDDVSIYRCDAGRWWLRLRGSDHRELLNATSRPEAIVCALEAGR